jgi:hypothetical protein
VVVPGGLVRLDLDHQVPAANVDVAGVGGLGVERVGDDHRVGQGSELGGDPVQ